MVFKASVDGGLTIDKEVEDVSAETRGIGAAKNPLTALSQEPEASVK
jgi:hypothetical protein